MYGKVFAQIYDGTLAGHWQAIVTMQQLIVLSNEDGVVDMTSEAISIRTSIPLHIVKAGLEHLAKPDPHSRTFGEDGKRIVLIDEHRPWGWRLVNHAKYRALRNMEQKREDDRKRIAEKRRKNNGVAIGSQNVANVAHADTDTNTGKASDATHQKPGAAPPGLPCPIEKLINLYHEVLPTCTRMVERTAARDSVIRARWRDKAQPKTGKARYTTEVDGLAYWRRFFEYVAKSDFLCGRSEPTKDRQVFTASLDWLLKPANFAKVVEGNYT